MVFDFEGANTAQEYWILHESGFTKSVVGAYVPLVRGDIEDRNAIQAPLTSHNPLVETAEEINLKFVHS